LVWQAEASNRVAIDNQFLSFDALRPFQQAVQKKREKT